MNNTATREILSTVPTHFTNHTCEISTVARDLRAASFGAITQREAIERARAIVLARRLYTNAA